MNKNYLQGHLSIQLNFVFDVINTRQKSILTFASESFTEYGGMKERGSTTLLTTVICVPCQLC